MKPYGSLTNKKTSAEKTSNEKTEELAGTTSHPEIPGLAAVIDPIRLRKTLRFLSGPPLNWGDLGDIQVRILRCHKGRCTFEVVLGTATGERRLIGKLYDSDVTDVYDAMERISRAGFGPEAEFSIPAPIAYIAPLHLMMQEKLEGRLAKDVFWKGSEEERDAAAERCGRWLVRFHAAVPKESPEFDVDAYMAFLEQCWCGVDPEDPLAGKLTTLFRCLTHAASALEPVESRACHGDYGPIQVILANGRTATCDWDRHSVSDPHRDVARFVVQLERLALKRCGSIRGLNRSAQIFLETYSGLGGTSSELNLRFYKAANHLKWCTEKVNKPHWRAGIDAAVEESLRSLEMLV